MKKITINNQKNNNSNMYSNCELIAVNSDDPEVSKLGSDGEIMFAMA